MLPDCRLSMWRFGVLLATLWATGCGTVGSTKLDVTPPKFAAFEVRDERPAEQRTSSKTKESYGEVSRLGDDAVTPPGPELLKAWLGDKIGARLLGRQIVLSEFSVQVVDPAVQINEQDRKSTRLNSSHSQISYAVFCLKKKTSVREV